MCALIHLWRSLLSCCWFQQVLFVPDWLVMKTVDCNVNLQISQITILLTGLYNLYRIQHPPFKWDKPRLQKRAFSSERNVRTPERAAEGGSLFQYGDRQKSILCTITTTKCRLSEDNYFWRTEKGGTHLLVSAVVLDILAEWCRSD